MLWYTTFAERDWDMAAVCISQILQSPKHPAIDERSNRVIRKSIEKMFMGDPRVSNILLSAITESQSDSAIILLYGDLFDLVSLAVKHLEYSSDLLRNCRLNQNLTLTGSMSNILRLESELPRLAQESIKRMSPLFHNERFFDDNDYNQFLESQKHVSDVLIRVLIELNKMKEFVEVLPIASRHLFMDLIGNYETFVRSMHYSFQLPCDVFLVKETEEKESILENWLITLLRVKFSYRSVLPSIDHTVSSFLPQRASQISDLHKQIGKYQKLTPSDIDMKFMKFLDGKPDELRQPYLSQIIQFSVSDIKATGFGNTIQSFAMSALMNGMSKEILGRRRESGETQKVFNINMYSAPIETIEWVFQEYTEDVCVDEFSRKAVDSMLKSLEKEESSEYVQVKEKALEMKQSLEQAYDTILEAFNLLQKLVPYHLLIDENLAYRFSLLFESMRTEMKTCLASAEEAEDLLESISSDTSESYSSYFSTIFLIHHQIDDDILLNESVFGPMVDIKACLDTIYGTPGHFVPDEVYMENRDKLSKGLLQSFHVSILILNSLKP